MGKSCDFSPCMEKQVNRPTCSLVTGSIALSGKWIWKRCAKFEIIYWHFKEGRRNTQIRNRKGRSAFRGLETGRHTVVGGNLLSSVGAY